MRMGSFQRRHHRRAKPPLWAWGMAAAVLLLLLLWAGTRRSVEVNADYEMPTQPPYTIALDAGHGGMDTGAEGYLDEVVLCEQTVDALYNLLALDGNYIPVRTRPNGEKYTVDQRVQNAAENKACLFLSIHGNSDGDSDSHGFECFPAPPGRVWAQESMAFAQCIAQQMETAGHRLRGTNGIRFAYYEGKRKILVDSSDDRVRDLKSFGVLEKAPCPAGLAEQGFVTNGQDVENWASPEGCQRAAQAYYQAICQYFGTDPQA